MGSTTAGCLGGKVPVQLRAPPAQSNAGGRPPWLRSYPLSTSLPSLVAIMSRVTFAIVALSLLLVVNGQVELKSFLGTCVNTGSSLDSCLLQLADKLKPYMKTGIPSLNIPKTDPMDIDKIAFQLKNPLGVVTVKFTENTVEGLSTHTINSIRANKAAKTLSMDIFVPKATAKG